MLIIMPSIFIALYALWVYGHIHILQLLGYHNPKDKQTGVCMCVLFRFGYFGKNKPELVQLLLCNVSGYLTDGQVYMSASGEEMVSINGRDLCGIDMLQKEGMEVRFIKWILSCPITFSS